MRRTAEMFDAGRGRVESGRGRVRIGRDAGRQWPFRVRTLLAYRRRRGLHSRAVPSPRRVDRESRGPIRRQSGWPVGRRSQCTQTRVASQRRRAVPSRRAEGPPGDLDPTTRVPVPTRRETAHSDSAQRRHRGTRPSCRSRRAKPSDQGAGCRRGRLSASA